MDESQYLYSNPSLPKSQTHLHYAPWSLQNVSNCIGTIQSEKLYPRDGKFARESVRVLCGGCGRSEFTKITPVHGKASKIWCFILMPFFCLGCSCLCLPSCKDIEHTCPHCNTNLGISESQCI